MPLTNGFSLRVTARDGKARTTTYVTPHGTVDTPAFMPVGTQGSVKSLSAEEVSATGARVILGNTYHLWLRPGAETVRTLGGLHAFTRWQGPMLTDSGGFQVFSLASRRVITDEGVTFRSHLDGSLRHLTPEESVRVQSLLGSDIAMVLDECPPGTAERPAVERAMVRTTAWAKRCLAAPRTPGQSLYGIVQGGVHLDLRMSHLADIAALPFDGIALGGLSVGEPTEDMHRILDEVASRMPEDRPRYLMGVGTPRDLLAGSLAGIDLFDCVLPTRNARNGQALTWHGRVNIKQARHKLDPGPLDPRCSGACCTTGYSRGYLRHLFIAGEILAARVITQHNLHFIAGLMAGMRAAIGEGRAGQYARETLDAMRDGDEVASMPSL